MFIIWKICKKAQNGDFLLVFPILKIKKGAVQKQLRKGSRGLNLRPLDIFLRIQFQIF